MRATMDCGWSAHGPCLSMLLWKSPDFRFRNKDDSSSNFVTSEWEKFDFSGKFAPHQESKRKAAIHSQGNE